MAPTVARLHDEVRSLVGRIMADAGLFAPDATTGLDPIVLQGLRKGMKCVALTLADGLAISDADAANLSTFAVERVMAEAELHCLRWALANWHRATRAHQEPLSSAVVNSGWLLDEKRAVQGRASDLEKSLADPYREPTDPAIGMTRGRYSPTGTDPLPPVDPYRDGCGPAGPFYPYPYGYGGWPW